MQFQKTMSALIPLLDFPVEVFKQSSVVTIDAYSTDQLIWFIRVDWFRLQLPGLSVWRRPCAQHGDAASLAA
jgi:hypothetical protein